MQLEELQAQWECLDAKLERSLRLQSELLRQTVVRPARRRVNWLAVWPALDIVFGLGVMFFAGAFLANHWQTWLLAAPAGVLLIAALVLLIIESILQLNCVSEIDWSGPVAEIQRSLARLRISKIRQFKWIMLSSPLVGFCVLIVGLQWLLDRLPEPHFILDKVDPWWVAGNLLFGALFLIFGQVVIGFIAKRYKNRGWWQSALDAISGTSISKAREELERWASLDAKAVDKVSKDAQ